MSKIHFYQPKIHRLYDFFGAGNLKYSDHYFNDNLQ